MCVCVCVCARSRGFSSIQLGFTSFRRFSNFGTFCPQGWFLYNIIFYYIKVTLKVYSNISIPCFYTFLLLLKCRLLMLIYHCPKTIIKYFHTLNNMINNMVNLKTIKRIEFHWISKCFVWKIILNKAKRVNITCEQNIYIH